MGDWADHHIRRLKEGHSVTFRPRGKSMSGRVEDGQEVTVRPLCVCGETDCPVPNPRVGDVVLCRVNGRQLLHLVKAIEGKQYQISNNRGRVNGWITLRSIYGVMNESRETA